MPKASDNPGSHLVRATATLQVHDADGNLVSTTVKEDDIALDNFLRWFKGMLSTNTSNVVDTTTLAEPLIDIGGTSRSLVWWTPGNGTTFNNNITASSRWRVHMGNGNGSTPTPLRTNFRLTVSGLGPLAANASTPASLTTNVVTITGAILNNLGATLTVREIGLSAFLNTTAGIIEFLMFHDSTADTPVNTGQTGTVTYTFTFP